MDNQQLKNIIKDIQLKEGVGLAEIAAQTGLDRSYLSAFIHAKVKKTVTEKMLGKLTKGFPAFFNGKQHARTASDGQSHLSGSVTIQDYKDSIEKRIAEIEARRLEAVQKAEELKAFYNDVKEDKKALLRIIDENLTQLLLNSTKHLAYLEKILLVDRADHETTMDSLDRLEHQPVGTNSTAAGKRELDASKRLRKKDKKNRDGVDS